jgi:hypothetical protein
VAQHHTGVHLAALQTVGQEQVAGKPHTLAEKAYRLAGHGVPFPLNCPILCVAALSLPRVTPDNGA